MNKQTSRAIAYAQNALSFLTLDNSINSIYLFGSSVRGELEEESDIDIFIDCSEDENPPSLQKMRYPSTKGVFGVCREQQTLNKEIASKRETSAQQTDEKDIENRAKESFSRFYSSKDYDKWKILRFTYPLSVKVGKLDEWELKESISAEGILLYSKQTVLISSAKQVLFIISLPQKKTKYLKLVRELYGRKERGYSGKGMVDELKGKKLSSNVIILPKENGEIIKKLLNKEKIEYSFREMVLF